MSLKRKTQTDLLPFTVGESVALIALERIDTAPQVREDFEPEPLAELAADIAARGVMQPITVRQIEEGRFLVVAGERRFRAAGMAGLTVIPALVRELDDATALDMQLAENIQREELTLQETAKAIRALYTREKSLAKVAALVSKSKPWVSKHLALTMEDASNFATALLRDGITEDMEILNLVTKAHNDFGGHRAWEMARQIRAGEMNRTKAREFLKELKAQAEAEAAQEEEIHGPEAYLAGEGLEPQEPAFILWNELEALEEQLADDAANRNEPNYKQIANDIGPDKENRILDEFYDAYQQGREAYLASSQREALAIIMEFTRRDYSYGNWYDAAFALGFLNQDLILANLLQEYFTRNESE